MKTQERDLHILTNISLDIKSGMSVAITGVSGSGKSSLLHLMAGFELPTSGQIFYGEQDITELDEDARAQLRAQHIGFIFQSFQLLPGLNALENVILPMEILNRDTPADHARFWLEKVGLGARVLHYPSQLSGGEQQRVAIARAFAIAPKILFADEPTGNLDKTTGQMISDLLFALNKEHKATLVIVTHDDTLAKRCEYHWPLDDGRLVC